MTTAARPTWDTAKGGTGKRERDLSAMSNQYSARDLASHTKLKSRQDGQGTREEYRSKDFRGDLEERERVALKERTKERARRDGKSVQDSPPAVKKSRTEAVTMATLDADDPVDSSDSDGDDSDDDTAVLMAELNKIKAEKARDEAEKEAGRREEEEQIRMENILSGNPLLKEKYSDTGKTDMKIKKRWDDDVVFKNCSRAEPDARESNFINDSLRNEFHKRFMDKYIK